MVIKPATIEKIRKIIEKHHNRLLVGILGPEVLTQAQREELRRQGFEIADQPSYLETLYYHNYLNPQDSKLSPTTEREMAAQQATAQLPKKDVHSASKDYLNANVKNLIEKQKADTLSKMEILIRETNNEFKFNTQQGLDDLVQRDESISQLKIRLRDASGDGNRNWDRIVNTEVSNAISLGSLDRIVDENVDKSTDEVYVYRIVVNDAALCKYCRRFYLDSDGTPKLYRLSTLLSNGSNVGRKKDAWLPVATATHPNERCSQVIELKPGWKLLPGGSVTFIGREAWDAYIAKKVVA